MVDFLTTSFSGGTDFEMDDLKEDTMQRIANACENGNQFFYHVMGSNPNRNVTGNKEIKYDSENDTWMYSETK